MVSYNFGLQWLKFRFDCAAFHFRVIVSGSAQEELTEIQPWTPTKVKTSSTVKQEDITWFAKVDTPRTHALMHDKHMLRQPPQTSDK